MALTQLRGEQIRDGIIKDRHLAADAAISYSKLDLAGQIVASDLNNDGSVEDAALDSKLITLWDMVQGVQSGTGSSVVVTTEVLAAAATDTPQTGVTAKGVLLTGTGTDGAGTSNYRVQIRNAATGEPIADGTDEDPSDASDASSIYAELRNDGTDYILYFFDSNDQAYTFTTDTQIDFLFLEVFSYLTAPAKGFIAGVGFADVVGIQGSHNHNDLYYTQTQLDGGQLDNRYYTETELDGGQLDNRYYTETELDPAAAATGDNVLDARYYRESELSSSASGSAGASLIGVDAAAVSGLDSTDVQSALAELQGDINDITSGDININHSLDDAYDDGSIITVDNTDVDFQITDTKKFKVSDSAGVSIVEVDALSAGDTLSITATTSITGNTDVTGTFDVTGDSTLDNVTMAGNLAQSGGTVTLNATGNVDIDSSATVSIDGTEIDLTSTGSLNFNDSIQTSAIAFSQADSDGFASEFAYDSQTDFDWSTRGIGTTAVSSVMAALNTNREDLYEYVELLRTQGAAVGTAAGANLIGVDGITGITPTGKTLGADSNLQEMLEGIVNSGGGSDKHYATLQDFIDAKAGGEYFNVNTQIWVEDIERQIRVYTQTTDTVEGTDWDYIWGEARPMGGTSGTSTPKFHSIITNTEADAIKLSAANGGIDIDAGSIAVDSTGTIAITANDLTLNDQYLSAALPLSQTGVTGLSSNFDTATSIVGAVNENADDLATLKTDLADTTDSSSGADMIGVTGITGIIPTGGTVGSDGTVQSMLEGIAKSAGGIKTYDSESDFTTDKANGEYLPADTMVYFKDNDRFAIVLIENTQTVEGTDWDYLWGANQPLAGGDFVVNVTDTTVDAVKITSAGGVDINGAEGITLDNSDANLTLDNTGVATLQSTKSFLSAPGESVILTTNNSLNANVGIYAESGQIIMNASSSMNMGGAGIGTSFTVTGDEEFKVTTSGDGQVQLVSASEIDLDAPNLDVHGDVTIATDKQLNVDKINITSVDPSDHATISGQRSGTLNTANILSNSGFEAGLGADADDWTEGSSAARTDEERYYNAYSMHIQATDLAADEHALTQAITGATASTAHNVSFYARGSVGGTVTVQLNGGAAKTVDMSLLDGTWRRFNVDLDADNGTDGNFYITISGTGTEDYDFYIDAVMVVEGAMQDYFSDSQSELVFTIGDDDNDRIVMRSVGTTTTDLMTINQTTVEILGDLVVSGTTTTVESQDLLVTDNTIVLNSGQSTGTLDAFVEVDRGSDANVSIKWNESTDQWELTNDGTNFATIVTSGASGALSMDEAYDGGSTVSVDDTNVIWTLGTTKSFSIADATDTNKFTVTEGTGVDSIKVDTTGGVDIDAQAGITINENSGSSVVLDTNGTITLTSATGQSITSSSDTLVSLDGGAEVDLTATLIDINGQLDVDGASADIDTTGAISLDAAAASNFTVDSADLTVSTTTSGNVAINAATTVDIDAGTSVTIDATNINTTGVLTQNGAVSITGDIDVTGAFDVTGDSTFDKTTIDGNLAQSGGTVVLNATGVVDVDSTDQFTVDAVGISLDSSAASNFTTSVGDLTLSSAANVVINGTSSIDMDSASVTVDSTGAISLDAAAASNFTVDSADLTVSTTTSGNVVINSVGNASIDAVGVSIDGTAASNVSVTGANLTVSTITSGDVNLTSAGELVFSDSRLSGIEFTDASNASFVDGVSTSIVGAINAAYSAAAGANTLDEVYDGESGVTRVITVDDGSVEFDLTDTYEFNISDSTSADIFSVKALSTGDTVQINAAVDVNASTFDVSTTDTSASSIKLASSGGIDIDSNEGINIADDSGSSLAISTTGAMTMSSATGTSIALSSDTLVSLDGGAEVDLTATLIDINGNVDIDGSTLDIDTTAAFSIDGAAASNVSVTGADLTLSTATSGNVVVTSVGDVTVDGVGISIDGTAASNVSVTGNSLTLSTITSGDVVITSAGDLTFQDSRTSAIPFSDTSNTTLPGDSTSILGALKTAYEKSIDMGYEEKTATSTDVTNDYIVLSDTAGVLPDSGITFPASPSALRGAGYYVAVYLNGLRLADTEWNYNYDSTNKQITFDGTDDITLVAGDKIMVETRKIN